MKKKTIGDRRLVITKNLIMMLVALVVIFVAIFAWFTQNKTVTAGGMSVKSKSADFVELALPKKFISEGKTYEAFPIDNADWSNEIRFTDTGYFKDFVKDITSNGEQFVIPNFQLGTLKTGRRVIADDTWEAGLSSKEALNNDRPNDDDQYNYISLEFYARSNVNRISVLGDSFLATGSELENKSLTGANVSRPSTYGAASNTADAFSADAVVGAMRVSLEGAAVDSVKDSTVNSNYTVENTYNNGATDNWSAASQLSFLWLPRPDLYLITDDDSDNWRLITGIKPTGNSARNGLNLTGQQVDEIAEQTYCHSFYEGNYTTTGNVPKGLTPHKYQDINVKQITGADQTVPNYFKVSSANLGESGSVPQLGQNTVVGSFENASSDIQFNADQNHPEKETTGYYVYKFTLNIWIEGEDAESRRSMNTGMYSLEIDFGN